MADTLEIFGTEYTDVTGIVATDDNGNELTYTRGGGSTQNVWYATCSSSASSSSKTASTAGAGAGSFTLAEGNMVHILCTNENTATSPTISIDGTTAKNIKQTSGSSDVKYLWQAGAVIDLTYDGTAFIMTNCKPATTVYYGPTLLSTSTQSTSTTIAATPSAVKSAYDLASRANSYIVVTHTSAEKTAAAGNNYTDTVDISDNTLNGYKPIAIVGWNTIQTSGANVAYFNICRLYISSASSGSGEVTIAAKNLGGSSMTVKLEFQVLWKEM